MKKNIFFFFLALVFMGCALYENRINLSPENSVGWNKIYSRCFTAGCNEGEVEVNPIVLGVEGKGQTFLLLPIPSNFESGSNIFNEKGAWTYVKFKGHKRIHSCELSFISLKDRSSGGQIKPVSSETTLYSDRSGIYTTGCYYYFNLNEIAEHEYDFVISKDVFDCIIDPISYRWERARQNFMMQMM